MSAEILWRAASLIRERAKAADQPGDEWWNVDSFAETTNYEDADHFVAFGRPAVAIAIADWLDGVARADRHEVNGADIHHALTVARTYLGESA